VLKFDPSAADAPAPPRDAATVVVLRDGETGPEVFCVVRHQQSGFMGGAAVFPGGKLDAGDLEPAWRDLTNGLDPRTAQLADTLEIGAGLAVAALRELLEEAELLAVVGAAVDATEADTLRRALTGEGARPLRDLLKERALKLDTRGLVPFARWITPRAEARRFDTRFYVARAPSSQRGAHDEHETTASFWATPREVLRRWSEGELFLAPPTSHTLELLSEAPNVDAAIALAREMALAPICPHFCLDGDFSVLALPGDPLYPELASPPADPRAPTRFVLQDGRFVSARA
jgi:8-oxo-dGTP pyrophosphatase MutT (NUDIX family)